MFPHEIRGNLLGHEAAVGGEDREEEGLRGTTVKDIDLLDSKTKLSRRYYTIFF